MLNLTRRRELHIEKIGKCKREKIENTRKWISTKIIILKRDLSNGILGFLFMQRN